jgi:hypothetical protein
MVVRPPEVSKSKLKKSDLRSSRYQLFPGHEWMETLTSDLVVKRIKQ